MLCIFKNLIKSYSFLKKYNCNKDTKKNDIETGNYNYDENENIEMKPREKETFKVGDRVNIYGRDAIITEIKGDIAYYKGETSSGSINFERDWKLIKKI